MRLERARPLLLFMLVCMALACSGSASPEDRLAEANKAFFSNKDYDEALELYESLVNASGDKTLPGNLELEAYLNLIRCRIAKDDFDGAMASLKKMRARHESSLTMKHLATIIGDFVRIKAVDQAIEVLEMIKELFPDELTPEQKELLKAYIEKILKDGATDEQIKRLKILPYL